MEENTVKLGNKEPFSVLLVTPNKMSDRDWSATNYLSDLTNDTFCEYVNIDPNDYLNILGQHLLVTKHTNPHIQVQLINEQKDYIYEIMYVEVPEGTQPIDEVNEFASLLKR